MPHVEPDIAIATMTRLWRNYGNEVSSPLLATWRTMCDALNQAGQTNSSAGWSVLAMPTGTGKTQFAALYCALLPNPTLDCNNFRSIRLHPAVLFVTRLMSEASKFAEQVNKLAGQEVAAAYHSHSPVGLTEANRFPVLAITHQACERYQFIDNAAKTGGYEDTTWDHLMSWQQSRRAKVIIDETPNFITSVQINANWLAQLGALKWVPNADPKMFFDLEILLTQITDAGYAHEHRELYPDEFELVRLIDTAKIREHLSALDEYAMTVACGSKTVSLRKVCLSALSAIETMQANGWGWVSFRGQTAQLNSAKLHPSLQNGSGVILDATAALYPGYSLLSPPANVISAPSGVRDYSNVTLYVARGHNAGKGHFTDNAKRL